MSAHVIVAVGMPVQGLISVIVVSLVMRVVVVVVMLISVRLSGRRVPLMGCFHPINRSIYQICIFV